MPLRPMEFNWQADHPHYYNAYAANPDTIGRQTPVIGAKVWTKSSFARKGGSICTLRLRICSLQIKAQQKLLWER